MLPVTSKAVRPATIDQSTKYLCSLFSEEKSRVSPNPHSKNFVKKYAVPKLGHGKKEPPMSTNRVTISKHAQVVVAYPCIGLFVFVKMVSTACP